MFLQRLLHAAGLEQGVVAVELHDLAQVGHHLVAPTVVGNLQEAHVETLIHRKKRIGIGQTRLGGGFQFGVQGA